MLIRLKVLRIIFLLAWTALFLRLFYWQVKSSGELSRAANLQLESRQEITTPRGKVLTADNFPLALSSQFYLLFAQPNLIKDEEDFFQKLSFNLTLDKEKIVKVIKNKDLQWYPLAKKIDKELKEEIEGQKLTGLGFQPQWVRVYPEASMAAQLLGFVGTDEEGKEKGYYGLEGYYDRELKGLPGENFWERDLFGRMIIFGKGAKVESKPGRNLKLFLDRSAQFLVEEELKKGIEKYQAVSGSAIILDPYTGGVLAMASFPSYDPVNFAFVEEKTLFTNPIISSSFEPGSVFKPFVMAAAIDLGLVKPATVCTACGGPVQIGEYTIRTWNEKYFPNSTMTEVIQHSDNTGMVFVAQKLGVKNLFHYLVKFGFNEKTDIDLEGEFIPALRNEGQWREIDLATAGFGQGIAVTPIQLIRAMAAIANGGRLVAPRMVEKMVDKGKELTIKTKKVNQIVRPITARVITEMMINAVEKGEAKWAKPKGYQIAGKTGTAQIPVAGHYDKEKTIASFIGFAPAGKPRFVMLVTLKEPKTSPWGSETAAPLWFEIAKGIFRLWGIPPG